MHLVGHCNVIVGVAVGGPVHREVVARGTAQGRGLLGTNETLDSDHSLDEEEEA